MAMIFISSVIAAPAGEVWPVVRDFNGLPIWHPAIESSQIEQNKAADQIGCVRSMVLAGNGKIREQLLAMSDYDFSYTYSVLESEMPMTDYVATIRLHPITDTNQTFAEWSAQFNCAPADEQGLVTGIGNDVFQAGFTALSARFR